MSKKEFLENFTPYNQSLFIKDFDTNAMFLQQALKRYYLDYFQDVKDILDKIELDNLNEVNELLFNALENGKQIFTMGNGGSGATASHLVCDLNKGVNFIGRKKFKAISLIDNLPTLLAYANDISYSNVFCEQLKNFMNKEDIVIGFSGSGNSRNVIKAIEFANEHGGITIGFLGFNGGILSEIAQISIIVPINDMQKCEDIHLILCHLIMQTMNELLKINSYG